MRLLSTIAMAAAAGVIALIGQRLYDRRVAIIAGLIFAIIPAVSRFAQEARPYAVAILVAAVATLLLLRGLEKPTWPRLIAYGLSITVLALTQIVAVPILLAHGVGVLLWRRNQPLIRWVVVVGIGLALAAPVVLLSTGQYAHQVGSLPNATVDGSPAARPPVRVGARGRGDGILAVFAWTEKWRQAAFARPGPYCRSQLSGSPPTWATPTGCRGTCSSRCRFRVARRRWDCAAGHPRGIAVVLVLARWNRDQQALRWVGSHDQWTYPEGANAYINYTALANHLEGVPAWDAIAYADRSNYFLLDIGLAYHAGQGDAA
jgi:mannosyltransferase